MADLAREFFERDLSDAEWKELGRQLAREDAVADRFLGSAQAYHAGLGIPEPGSGPKGGTGGLGLGPLGTWMGALVIGTALGGAVVHFWFPAEPGLRGPAASAPAIRPGTSGQALVATPGGGIPATPRPSLPQPTLAPPPLNSAAPRVASAGYPGLAAVVHLASQGLVTARVLDAQGQEQRVLYAGVLEAGSWSFAWDGRDEAGSSLPPGRYSIEVQEGSHILKKDVVVGVKH